MRGKFPNEINIHYAQSLGGKFVAYMKAKKIALGYDNRFSSPVLVQALLNHMSCEVIVIGLCTSPMLYFTVKHLQLDGGIMVTASHNPITDNGFKLLRGNLPLTIDETKQMLAINLLPTNKEVKIIHYDINQQYIKNLLHEYSSKKKLKIAWDLGNCTVAKIIHPLIEKLPEHQHILLNEKISEYATADPMVDNNLEEITQLVKKEKCDVGFAFDGDGDRIRIIDNQGKALSSSYALMILIQDVLKFSINKTVIIDVKISDKVIQLVESLGGTCLRCRTGHTFMQYMIHETNAIMAGDGSGHIFFEYDDALYAALLFIKILSNSSWPELVYKLPEIYSIPEVRIKVDNKHNIILHLKRYLMKNNIVFDDLDGIRVNIQEGWWLIRASNTEEVIVICCESIKKDNLNAIYTKALSIINITKVLTNEN